MTLHTPRSGGILAFVLAGGEGRRLRPLTADRAKPAVRFAGDYRIVDFALANLVNSAIAPIYVLAQYKADARRGHAAGAGRGPPRHCWTAPAVQSAQSGLANPPVKR